MQSIDERFLNVRVFHCQLRALACESRLPLLKLDLRPLLGFQVVNGKSLLLRGSKEVWPQTTFDDRFKTAVLQSCINHGLVLGKVWSFPLVC